ncbi:MAG TPA: TlpA disulfide reductase family protein, partial [Terriglobia bacterium]
EPLPPDLRQHWSDCEACRAEMQGLETVWGKLGAISSALPGPTLRPRFENMLAGYQEGLASSPRGSWAGLLAPANREQALSRMLLLAGLLLVAVAVSVYRYLPSISLAPASLPGNLVGEWSPIPVSAIRGSAAPDFELPDINGASVRLSDLRGKVLLVNFWATWCVPCVTEMPWFSEFQERYGPQGFQVVAISLDQDPSDCAPFIEKHKLGNLMVLLGNQSTGDLFGGLLGLPTTFIVDREGKFYSKHQGLVSRDTVEAEVAALLRSEAR